MADRPVSELNAAVAGNLHDAALVHVVDLLEGADANKNVKATVAQVRAAVVNADSVTTEKILNGAVTETKIATGAVTNIKIAAAAVTLTKIASGAVVESKIATGAVVPAKTSFLPQVTASGHFVFLDLITGFSSNNGAALPEGWSVSTPGTGQVTVTHNIGASNYNVVALTRDAPISSLVVPHLLKSGTSFTITTTRLLGNEVSRYNVPVEVFFFRYA